ncbi:MAG: hypothetical protein BWY41_02258 [Candidatus Atribacteria bacterium ADurb.Bin276]|jgi:hypothetical protein|uniref:Uncharacterized protein n=1 Tax=Candidatus Atribacter allofermentans TaxID=1852833 RepID=A0A1V5SID6_9BACT|nr:MAG: hypothetical protein BWY41_02258 [Candidatus Atribacteria bacterium ADurb.Bin276]
MVSGERSISLKYNFKIPNHGSEFWASPSPSPIKGEKILRRHCKESKRSLVGEDSNLIPINCESWIVSRE